MKPTVQDILSDIKIIATTKYVRGSGAGGQKINSTSSRAEIRFDIFELELDKDIEDKLIGVFGQNNITIQDQSSRVRETNMETAWTKIEGKLETALKESKPRLSGMKKSVKATVIAKSKRDNKMLKNKKMNRRIKTFEDFKQ